MNKFELEQKFAERMKRCYPPSTRLVLLMLIIGLLIGGCISTALLCCVQINRVNEYEKTIQSLLEKTNKD